MAEYITKEQAFELLDDGDMYARKALTEMKPADVIERSKVDKAIEDIKFNIKCNTDQKTGRVNLLGQGQIMMLDILKKYIGE